MNIQQLRYVSEVARRGLNQTETAQHLHVSQAGVSAQIRDLEQELGVLIFERNGKRLVGLTVPGSRVLKWIERTLSSVDALRNEASHYASHEEGRLTLVTTHTHARYVLPEIVSTFRKRYPLVSLNLLQGSPTQVAERVAKGEADIGISSSAVRCQPDLSSFPCGNWTLGVVVARSHPLAQYHAVSLADIAAYPLVTYDHHFLGDPLIEKAFEQAGLTPTIALTATDADVIKTYVRLGLGVGLLEDIAVDAVRDPDLVLVALTDSVVPGQNWLSLRAGNHLRTYGYRMIELVAPHLSLDTVRESIRSLAA